MHRLRNSASKCWQNMHEKLHFPSGAHEELTMTEKEPKTQTEHILDAKQPTEEIPTTQTLLTDLPTELFEQIFSYLPLSSKVCLVLACKGLYQLYSSVLTAEELLFPQASHFWGIPPRKASDQRKILLTQLEDSRWACCGRCQKLHPRSEFPGGKLEEEESDPYDRACMPCAGIVDICPCIALTVRDRDHMVDYLKGTAGRNVRKKLHHISRGLLKDSWNEKNEHTLVHDCHAHMAAVATIHLSVTKSEQFLAYAQYSTYLDKHEPGLASVHVCRHLTLHDRFAPLKPKCKHCDTHSIVVSRNSEVKVVRVTRFLGRDSWFGNTTSAADPRLARFTYQYQWYKQCRITSYY